MKVRPLPHWVRDSIQHIQAVLRATAPRTEVASRIRAIAAAHLAAIPALLGFMHSADGEVVSAAAEAVHSLALRCSPIELAQLDMALREASDRYWISKDPTDVVARSRGLTGALGVVSFNRNGYVREAAIRALSDVHSGLELPFLLIRLNDWVHPIRDAARRAILSRVEPKYAAQFVFNLSLIWRLRGQHRADHQPVAEAILNLLMHRECREALLAGLELSERETRRAVFRLLLDAREPQPHWLYKALDGRDTVLKLWAARELRSRMAGAPLRELLERLERDRFMPIRREALYGFVENLPEAAPAMLRTALLDTHVSIREAARFYVRKAGDFDFAAFYRNQLADIAGEAGKLAAAVAGLGDSGVAADAERVVEFFGHPISRVRRAAVTAVGRLAPESFVIQLLAALDDPAAGVAAAARDVLQERLQLISPDQHWSVFDRASTKHTRRTAVRLMAHLPWWDSARLLVTAAGTADDEVRSHALRHLEQWRRNYHRLSVRPTHQQLIGLEREFHKYRDRLDEASITDIASHISYAKRE